jgi:hypothetical protein
MSDDVAAPYLDGRKVAAAESGAGARLLRQFQDTEPKQRDKAAVSVGRGTAEATAGGAAAVASDIAGGIVEAPKQAVGGARDAGQEALDITKSAADFLDENVVNLGGDLGAAMKAAGIGGYVGPPTGYILRFSNGLVVYLSGDTGITGEQDKVVRGFYKAKLVVMNIGDTYTTGPTEAAYVINELIKPVSVIASHANELATKGGQVLAGTRTDIFQKAVKVPVYIPLSGRTMEFNSGGACVSGC